MEPRLKAARQIKLFFFWKGGCRRIRKIAFEAVMCELRTRP